jgi:putative tricarboxylic transport membrane protein
MEGYPMARRGKAGRAMAMALFASFFGGVVGALIMTFASPFISGIALEFGPVEYFGLAVFGLSVIVSISGRSLVKGMMSAFFGLLIACIGFDPISGFLRFTFGMMEMMEGSPFIPTLMGLFAVSEVFNEVQKARSSAPSPAPAATSRSSSPTAKPSARRSIRSVTARAKSKDSPPANAPTIPVPAAP